MLAWPFHLMLPQKVQLSWRNVSFAKRPQAWPCCCCCRAAGERAAPQAFSPRLSPRFSTCRPAWTWTWTWVWSSCCHTTPATQGWAALSLPCRHNGPVNQSFTGTPLAPAHTSFTGRENKQKNEPGQICANTASTSGCGDDNKIVQQHITTKLTSQNIKYCEVGTNKIFGQGQTQGWSFNRPLFGNEKESEQPTGPSAWNCSWTQSLDYQLLMSMTVI